MEKPVSLFNDSRLWLFNKNEPGFTTHVLEIKPNNQLIGYLFGDRYSVYPPCAGTLPLTEAVLWISNILEAKSTNTVLVYSSNGVKAALVCAAYRVMTSKMDGPDALREVTQLSEINIHSIPVAAIRWFKDWTLAI
jgi:hypothetical protein